MWPHREKGAGHTGKKRGGPSYGRADRPMYFGVYVVPCMYTWKYTQPSHFWEKWGCLSVLLGGWVEKMGACLGKKGGRPGKPPPDGGKWGWTAEGGENPPGTLGSPWSERGATEPVGTRLGRGTGFCPSDTLPSPYGTPNRFLEALVNILEPLDVHTPLPTHPCVHVETATYPCLGLQVCPGTYPGSRKPEIPEWKSLCDARAGITTRMRDNPLRACEDIRHSTGLSIHLPANSFLFLDGWLCWPFTYFP